MSILLDSAHFDKRLFKIVQYILYMVQDNDKPLYDNGSLGSTVLDFGIGLIINLFHARMYKIVC